MLVELIPVIEITNYNLDIKTPDNGPYWEYQDDWERFHQACNLKVGFPDELTPYLKGSAFYELSKISDNNLIKLTNEHTEDLRKGNYDRDQASSFYGGYVLKINEQDKYFPQCCGDLSDIRYWIDLVSKREKTFYQGHPEPSVTIGKERIIFEFSREEFEEGFVPPPPDIKIEIDIISLHAAVDVAKEKLARFSERLKKINITERLNIPTIENLLVWGDN